MTGKRTAPEEARATGGGEGLSLGLGLDAGGTRTRWALATASGRILAEGEASAMSALLMGSEEGRRKIRECLQSIAAAVLPSGHPTCVHAGFTGLGEREEGLRALLAQAFGVGESAVVLRSDIVYAYLGLFAPGEGYVVYAGTGSVAAYVDESGTVHRAGGRGVLLDDAGGGYWIAREALKRTWRGEDEYPGAWKDSPLARELFRRIGGHDWSMSRDLIYRGDRGELGKLAVAVADVAAADPAALAILEAAGSELARLALAMIGRHGPRPVTLAGRAAQLHPAIGDAMRAALPQNVRLDVRAAQAHRAAARIAAGGPGTPPQGHGRE